MVVCGNHYRDDCGQCPFVNSTYFGGKPWCNGECQWNEYGINYANKSKGENKIKWRVHLHQLGLGAETRQMKKKIICLNLALVDLYHIHIYSQNSETGTIRPRGTGNIWNGEFSKSDQKH